MLIERESEGHPKGTRIPSAEGLRGLANFLALSHTLRIAQKQPKCLTRPYDGAPLSGPYGVDTATKEDPSAKTHVPPTHPAQTRKMTFANRWGNSPTLGVS